MRERQDKTGDLWEGINMKRYYALEREGPAASITIYGDITSWPVQESDVSAYLLSRQIDGIEADTIDVYINSYGGEVGEGLAIYNALKRHKAKVITHCDGFACSVASVVFMAGCERLMRETSLLMIHNAWTAAHGNASQLRKAADDLETISAAAANAYRATVNLGEAALARLLDDETWLTPQDAVSMGFATGMEKCAPSLLPTASARQAVLAKMQAASPMEGILAEGLIQVDAKKIAREILAELQTGDQSHTLMHALTRKEVTK